MIQIKLDRHRATLQAVARFTSNEDIPLLATG